MSRVTVSSLADFEQRFGPLALDPLVVVELVGLDVDTVTRHAERLAAAGVSASEGSLYRAVMDSAMLELDRLWSQNIKLFDQFAAHRRGPWWARVLGWAVAWLAVAYAVKGARMRSA